MRIILGGSILLVVLMSIYLFANPSDYDYGFIASGRFNKCYRATRHRTLGDVRPSVIFKKWSCFVDKDDHRWTIN